jgi:hypothetical protein
MKELNLKLVGTFEFWLALAAITIGVMIYIWAPEFQLACLTMNIDCIAQYASITKDTVLTIAAMVGAYVALRGLSTWNRQLKGGVEYDLTRRILKCTYRLREAIKSVRNSVMWVSEMPTPPETEASKMSMEQLRQYGLENAYQKRWDKVSEVRTDL